LVRGHAAGLAGACGDVVDIMDRRDIEAALSRLPSPGQPDILVNSAGYLGKTQAFVSHAVEEWQRIVGVNLVGTMQVTQAVLPRMIGGARTSLAMPIRDDDWNPLP
jgi:NAD(P)-dependent dehydrogenase (short-subunit alcohol dehydrogenase family)